MKQLHNSKKYTHTMPKDIQSQFERYQKKQINEFKKFSEHLDVKYTK